MKKLISVFLPMAIIFSLAGCQLDTEAVYIKNDFRKIVKYHDGTKNQVDGIPPRYEVRIDGNWYDADSAGNLTRRGQMQKQMADSDSDSGDGGGGC